VRERRMRCVRQAGVKQKAGLKYQLHSCSPRSGKDMETTKSQN